MPRRDTRSRFASLPGPLRGLGGLAVLLAAAAALAAAVIALTGAVDEEEVEPERVFAAAEAEGGEDPFAWQPSREDELVSRAAFGYSHVLYELSPGGVLASARRTAEFEDLIDEAARRHDADPELMEAMVFLESAGRPEVIAGGVDPEGASGLAQILASTGIDLLGMDIDLGRSTELTETINSSLERAAELRSRASQLAERGGAKRERKAARLLRRAERLDRRAREAQRERVRVDERFDPAAALDGMGRYLAIAGEEFGRADLAVTSYHMGIGNLGDVIAAYDGDAASEDLSYAQLYFDSSPTNNPASWDLLEEFQDDSATYYWRVLAAREIMRLFREDREELNRLAELHGNKATAEEVFHPESTTRTFDDPEALEDALGSGELTSIPAGGPYGYRVGPQLGELTGELDVERSLYRSLRPVTVATLIYMAGRVQAITGERGRDHDLIITSAVRDQAYQEALVGRNSEATSAYSLHTTGYSFDVLREYANNRQARAFQFVLDRLKALGVIDYAREPRAIHVTVSPLAEPLLD